MSSSYKQEPTNRAIGCFNRECNQQTVIARMDDTALRVVLVGIVPTHNPNNPNPQTLNPNPPNPKTPQRTTRRIMYSNQKSDSELEADEEQILDGSISREALIDSL